jgi:hypothetical protein
MVERGATIKALADCMNHYPEQRICQIIFNAIDKQGLAREVTNTPADLFYINDSTLLGALVAYAADAAERRNPSNKGGVQS